MRAVSLRTAVAILIAGIGVGLAVGSANAETAALAALAELEAPDSADSGASDATPTGQVPERRRERRETRYQRSVERLARARAVLFDGIELSAEQSRGVDAIIEAELKVRRRFGELQNELGAARQQDAKQRIPDIRREGRAVRKQLKSPNECMEEMRALLSEEQRPTFDMNRARLAVEFQQVEPQKKQKKQKKRKNRKRSRADPEVKTEEADAEVKAEEADPEVKTGEADPEVTTE